MSSKLPSPNKRTGKEDYASSRLPNSNISRSKNETIVKREENYLARCNNYRLTSGYEVTICNCRHIRKIRIGERHSICNPQRWLCTTCLTTESVWACLSCPNVACGRYIKEHALTHFQETGHPLAIDVNELYVFCYKCDDYVLNDNNSSDIKVLREMLLAIRYQNFTGTTRSGHTLRSAMITEQEDLEMRRKMQQDQLDRDDRLFTAIWHSRFVRQRKSFRQWLRYIKWKRGRDDLPYESEEDSEGIVSDVEEDKDNCPDTSPPLPYIDQVTENVPKTAVVDDTMLPLPPKSPDPPLTLEILTNSETDIPTIINRTVDVADSESVEHSQDSRTNIEQLIENTTKTTLSKHSDTNLIIDSNKRNVIEEIVLEKPSSPVEHGDSVENTDTVTDLNLEQNAEEDDDKSDNIPPAPLNILSRPKRVNAAARYKQIFSSLGIGPLKREISCPIPSQRFPDEPPAKRRNITVPREPGRRSDRIRKIERIKELAAKRMKSRSKKGTRLSKRKRANRHTTSTKKIKSTASSSRSIVKKKKLKTRNYRPSSRTRRLISGPVETTRRNHPYRPPSLYDNIPNKAVTSLIPGVTGLRNLGNTCYLNSIIQVLGHLQKFRLCLLGLREMEIPDCISSKGNDNAICFATPQNKTMRPTTRRSTVELYNEQVKPASIAARNSERRKSGLNGGQSPTDSVDRSPSISPSPAKNSHQSPTSTAKDYWSSSLSLCNELDHLYQVMWSGKWKLVSPYHFLHSVWNLIPSFRGYTQQDAQEFLCELLDKIVSELKRNFTDSMIESKIAKRILKVVETVFEGRLKSEVRCLECGNVSSTVEPFWDLSLEFPERYHKISAKRKSSIGNRPGTVPSDPCTLQEMLENFTASETLDGGRVYGCSKCNFLHQSKGNSGGGQKKKTLYRKYSQLLTEAEKQLKVLELPQILRFHLKRFRWIGRNHREKISVHVDFPPELNMKKFCWDSGKNENHMYDLSAVVMHHGRGFGSGHYTANCWNGIGEFWVHCNDSNLELCSIEDVMASQAYILFYTLRGIDPQPHIFSPPLTPTVPSPNSLSPIASDVEAESPEISASDFEGTDSASL